jgi:hypothetical protein
MAEAELQPAGRGTTTCLPLELRFPVGWIVEHPGIERGFVRAVWFVIPLEYYLLTTFSNGFEASDFGAASAVSLIYVVILFILSSCLAASWTRRRGDFDQLLRIWSITLIVTWSASLALLALFTFTSAVLRRLIPSLGIDFDVVTHLVCNVVSSCLRTPPALTWQTFVIYLVYTSVALALIMYASRRFIPERHVSGALGGHREPNLIAVCIINAAIMTVFNTWTNSGIAIGIRNVLASSN